MHALSFTLEYMLPAGGLSFLKGWEYLRNVNIILPF